MLEIDIYFILMLPFLILSVWSSGFIVVTYIIRYKLSNRINDYTNR